MWSNDMKCKYKFMFPRKNLARKGLLSLKCYINVVNVEAHTIIMF